MYIVILLLLKWRRDRNKVRSAEDKYRLDANKQNQPKGSMDVWTNPVKHIWIHYYLKIRYSVKF